MRASTPGTRIREPGIRNPQNWSHSAAPATRLSWEQYSRLLEYRQLWDRLAVRLVRSERQNTPFVVGVTSSVRGEGKTTGGIGLAVALAQQSLEEVALIEADFHNPTLARDFGVPTEPGLIDYLTDGRRLLDTSKVTRVDGLTLFPAGNLRPAARGLNPERLNGYLRHQFQDVVDQLRREFSYVVLDLPPILGNVDTEEMLRFACGVVLMVRGGVTPLEKLRQATHHLASGQLLGVVYLGDQQHIPRWVSRLIAE